MNSASKFDPPVSETFLTASVGYEVLRAGKSMNVLVAVASRHGSTRAIAEAIAAELQKYAIAAEACDVDEVTAVDQYDAVVLGSGVYIGNWLPEAQEFMERHKEALRDVPVWLFSSGPLGSVDPKPIGDPPKIPDYVEAIRARGHHVFAGNLDPTQLGFGEKLIVKLVNAPAGDFRDWEEIREWTREIMNALRTAGAVNSETTYRDARY